jgi:hypothetical protein
MQKYICDHVVPQIERLQIEIFTSFFEEIEILLVIISIVVVPWRLDVYVVTCIIKSIPLFSSYRSSICLGLTVYSSSIWVSVSRFMLNTGS